MIVEVMKEMWSPCFLSRVAFGVFSPFGNVSSDQCVFPWCLFWFLLHQWMKCGCHVKLLLCYDSFSPLFWQWSWSPLFLSQHYLSYLCVEQK